MQCFFTAPRKTLIRRYQILSVLLLSITSIQCSGYPTGPYEPVLVVHAMLVAQSSDQEILVERTRPIADGIYRGLTPAEGVQVSVAGPAGVIPFRMDPSDPGRFHASFTPQAGQHYSLLVRGAEGRRVTAETTIPDAPRLVVPSRDTSVALLDTFRVVWSGSAPGYVVARSPLDGGPSSRYQILLASTRTDTTASDLVDLNDTRGHLLRIAAVDSNYVFYTREGPPGDLRPQSPDRSAVEGGYGIFGSVSFSNALEITAEEGS